MYRGIIRRFARQIIEVTLFLISIVEILPISWSNTRNTRTRVLLLIRGTFTLPFCVNLSWVKCVKRCLLGVETVRDFDRVEFAFASSGLYLFNYFSRQFFFLFFFQFSFMDFSFVFEFCFLFSENIVNFLCVFSFLRLLSLFFLILFIGVDYFFFVDLLNLIFSIWILGNCFFRDLLFWILLMIFE